MLRRFNGRFRLVCLLVAALPAAGFAQAGLDSAAARQRQLVADIEQTRSEYGPMAAELIEPLDSLALFYDANGDQTPAFATTEQVIQVVRANFGLYALEQVPMLNRLIEYGKAHGDDAYVWQLEQDLQEIARHNPEDLRSVPVLRAIADSRIDILQRYISGDFPPQIVLGCYYALNRRIAPHGCTAGRKGIAAGALLDEAHSNYRRAIDVLSLHELYSSPELKALEMDLIRTSYRYGRYLQGTTACRRAIERLTRLHYYDEVNDAAPAARAESLVRAADFQLYCGWNAPALNDYRAALTILDEGEVPQSGIDRIFAPEKPIEVPTFVDNILDVESADPEGAFVDVAFELTRFGIAQNVEVIAGGEHAGAETVESRIRRGRFRPFARDGELVDSPRLVVRYFLED